MLVFRPRIWNWHWYPLIPLFGDLGIGFWKRAPIPRGIRPACSTSPTIPRPAPPYSSESTDSSFLPHGTRVLRPQARTRTGARPREDSGAADALPLALHRRGRRGPFPSHCPSLSRSPWLRLPRSVGHGRGRAPPWRLSSFTRYGPGQACLQPMSSPSPVRIDDSACLSISDLCISPSHGSPAPSREGALAFSMA